MPRRSVPEPLSRRIGERIRDLRTEAGLTLEKLAYESDLGSKGHLSDLERGLVAPTVLTLERIARRLDVQTFDLLAFPEAGARARLVDWSRHATNEEIARVMRELEVDVPFRFVAQADERAPKRSVPLVDLSAAAGAFGPGRSVHPVGWIAPRTKKRLSPGMFVAQVRGRSMEPRIPDRAYVLFSAAPRVVQSGRIVLVQHRDVSDPETGGSYSVKRLERTGTGRSARVRLASINPDFPAVTVKDVSALRVIGELVEVLGARPN